MADERPPYNPRPDEQPVEPVAPDRSSQGRQYETKPKERRDREPDPLRGLLPGLILIVVGVLLFLTTRGTLSWGTWWQYLLIGLGVVFILDGLAHYYNPALRDIGFGRFIPGIILLFVGLAFVFGFDRWWPLAIIAAGIIILLNVFFRRR